jgi:hypothetical protein
MLNLFCDGESMDDGKAVDMFGETLKRIRGGFCSVCGDRSVDGAFHYRRLLRLRTARTALLYH